MRIGAILSGLWEGPVYYEDLRDVLHYNSLPPTVKNGVVIPNPIVPPPGEWLDEFQSRSNEDIEAGLEQSAGF